MIDHSKANLMPLLDKSFFERSVYEVAPDLIGCYVFTTIDDVRVGGMIIETEAYHQEDPFAHCYSDSTIPLSKESTPMLDLPGSLYLYWADSLPCLNLVCEPKGIGSAVLIRAPLPIYNDETMYVRRTSSYKAKYLEDITTRLKNLCNGPGVLSEALGLNEDIISQSTSALDPPFEIRAAVERPALVSGIRINLNKQFEKWARSKSLRSELPLAMTNDYGAKKWRFGAAEFRPYCRHSSFDQIWKEVT